MRDPRPLRRSSPLAAPSRRGTSASCRCRRPRRAARERFVASALAASAAAVLLACTGSEPPPARDTVTQRDSAPPVVVPPPPAPATAWNDTVAGPALFVVGSSPQVAQLVFPEFTDSTLTDTSAFDLSRVSGARIDLFSRAGAAGVAELATRPAAPAREEECTSWPTARITAARDGGREPAPWTIGFASGHAAPIPLDSVETLSRADSARLVADVARLASALPNDTAPSFRGLPFVVLAARRFAPARGVQAVAAEISRKVNQEARPREERILLIAERDSAQPPAPWTTAYYERVADNEETVEASDVLAAVFLGRERIPTLVIGREYGEGFAYALLERTAPKRWRLRWSSAYAGC